MVRCCPNRTIRLICEIVIIFRTKQCRHAKAFAKFHTLYGRNGINRRRQSAFQSVKHRLAHADRQTDHRTFNHTADRIGIFLCRRNRRLHFLPCRVILHRDDLFRYSLQGICIHSHRIKGGILHALDRKNMRADMNAPSFQNLHADCARKAKRCGQPAGEMTAAAMVIRSLIFHPGRKIRMPRSG